MEAQISFKLDDPEVLAQIIRILAGDNPTSKPRKPRKPMTNAEKEALKKRLADGKAKAAKAREEATKAEAAKVKPKVKPSTRKTTTRKAPAAKK